MVWSYRCYTLLKVVVICYVAAVTLTMSSATNPKLCHTALNELKVVVVCYVAAVTQTVVKHPPIRQLFNFDRVERLAAGDVASLAFSLDPKGRALVDEEGRVVVAPGQYKVMCEAGGLVTLTAPLSVVGEHSLE
jgi:hypothetical protein